MQENVVNRELSQLEFNRRVLAQAEDPDTPLLERLRFLCIFSSNMDEFYEIRIAGLLEQIRGDGFVADYDGLTAGQVHALISKRAHELVAHQYHVFNDVLTPALAAQGIRFLRRPSWTRSQAQWIKAYFFRELLPLLTPIGLSPMHPFPRVLNKTLNFAVELEGSDAFDRSSTAAIVQPPRALPRVILLPAEIAGCDYGFVFLSSILHAHMGELFPGMKVRGSYQFRVTRNSELFIDEEEKKTLREILQGELPHRSFGDAVRLEVAANCPDAMKTFLQQQFSLADADVFPVNGPVNLVRLLQVPDSVERADLKYPVFRPGLPNALFAQQDMFYAIREGDILLHHPYQSFAPVVRFIEQAAQDPDVVAIKQTVYRAGHDSALLQALINAARSGKEVTVIVELLARFDEETNINWATQLEEVGAHVVYGVSGYKVHAKMAMVMRRENGRIRRYAHLGTGNYHAQTARLYTDFGLFTCDEKMTSDVASIFNQLTGLGHPDKLAHLWQSPFTLHPALMKAIRRETEHARGGRKARIVAKVNALLETRIIEALYEASKAGVRIRLIVRGACALRPGIPGLSENIEVRSIIGRFLEHTRVFYFHNNKAKDVYLSSADWMHRNFFRRVEICFPVLDPQIKKRIIAEGLKPYLKDNIGAWEMTPDGYYHRRHGHQHAYSAQNALLDMLS
nr:polyphosphate kinase 1 [Noviherbaspirillum cavernae]